MLFITQYVLKFYYSLFLFCIPVLYIKKKYKYLQCLFRMQTVRDRSTYTLSSKTTTLMSPHFLNPRGGSSTHFLNRSVSISYQIFYRITINQQKLFTNFLQYKAKPISFT